jgi:hypothetical protein
VELCEPTIHLCSHCITLGDSLLICVPAEVHPPAYVLQCQHTATQVNDTELPSSHYCPPWVHKAFREQVSTNQHGKCTLFVDLFSPVHKGILSPHRQGGGTNRE